MNRILASSRGSVLAIVMMTLFTLGILGVSMSLQGVHESRLAQRHLYDTQAFWLAEAGIQKAFSEIRGNRCQGFRDTLTNASCSSCTCGSGDMLFSEALGVGEYEVTINNSVSTVISRGYYPNKATASLQRNIKVNVSGSPIFGYAAFSQGKMVFSNNALVDSYNSSDGEYGGVNISSSGNIGTNSTAEGAIDLSNNVIIMGSASTGAGGTITGSGNVTGAITHANNVTLAPIIVPQDLSGSADLGPMTLENNETKILAGGNYKHDNITFANNVILEISGDVKLYLTGENALLGGNNAQVKINADASLVIYTEGAIAFNNNVLLNNLSKKPSSFIIYSKYTGSDGVTISNNGTFYGAVYAKDTDITLDNNANVYGSMVGKTVDVANNDEVHFDLALSSLLVSGSQVPADWQEI